LAPAGQKARKGSTIALLFRCESSKWGSTGRVGTRERRARSVVGWIVRLHRCTRAKHTWIGLGHRGTSRFSSRDGKHSHKALKTRHEARKPNASTLKARNAKGEHARGKEARRTHSSATTKHVHALCAIDKERGFAFRRYFHIRESARQAFVYALVSLSCVCLYNLRILCINMDGVDSGGRWERWCACAY
jgi:hypothetical protein